MSKSLFVFQKLKTNMIPIGIRNRSASMSRPGIAGRAVPAVRWTPTPEPASGASTAPSRISVVMSFGPGPSD
jgi:hypothetical protein